MTRAGGADDRLAGRRPVSSCAPAWTGTVVGRTRMSETSHDRSTVIGTAPTGSRESDRSSTSVPPAGEGAPKAAGPQADRVRPDGAAASSLHRDITRALADLRPGRLAAVGSLQPATGTTHDVDLAEWRLNRLLERTRAATGR